MQSMQSGEVAASKLDSLYISLLLCLDIAALYTTHLSSLLLHPLSLIFLLLSICFAMYIVFSYHFQRSSYQQLRQEDMPIDSSAETEEIIPMAISKPNFIATFFDMHRKSFSCFLFSVFLFAACNFRGSSLQPNTNNLSEEIDAQELSLGCSFIRVDSVKSDQHCSEKGQMAAHNNFGFSSPFNRCIDACVGHWKCNFVSYNLATGSCTGYFACSGTETSGDQHHHFITYKIINCYREEAQFPIVLKSERPSIHNVMPTMQPVGEAKSQQSLLPYSETQFPIVVEAEAESPSIHTVKPAMKPVDDTKSQQSLSQHPEEEMSISGTNCTYIRMRSQSKTKRCANSGLISNFNNYGIMQVDSCFQNCAEDESCKFIGYRSDKKACTGFSSCDEPLTESTFKFDNYAVLCPKDQPEKQQQENGSEVLHLEEYQTENDNSEEEAKILIPGTNCSYSRMQKLSKAKRCANSGLISKFNNYGIMHVDSCIQKCAEDEFCKFIGYRPDKKACTGFLQCDEPLAESTFEFDNYEVLCPKDQPAKQEEEEEEDESDEELPISGTNCSFSRMHHLSKMERCANSGLISKFSNFGIMEALSCIQKCAEHETCRFVAYRPQKQACTGFVACDEPFEETVFEFDGYEILCPISHAKQQEIEWTDIPDMQCKYATLTGELEQHCHSNGVIDKKSNFGIVFTEANCAEKCARHKSCEYAAFQLDNSACTGFTQCDEFLTTQASFKLLRVECSSAQDAEIVSAEDEGAKIAKADNRGAIRWGGNWIGINGTTCAYSDMNSFGKRCDMTHVIDNMNNFGKQNSVHDCLIACTFHNLCQVVGFRPDNGACTGFSLCSRWVEAESEMESYKIKCKLPEGNWMQIRRTRCVYAQLEFLMPKQRCGNNEMITAFNNFGNKDSAEKCAAQCAAHARCKFIAYRRSKKSCTGFATCDSIYDAEYEFSVFNVQCTGSQDLSAKYKYRISNNGLTLTPQVPIVHVFYDSICIRKFRATFMQDSGHKRLGHDGSSAFDDLHLTTWIPQCERCQKGEAWLEFTTAVEPKCIQALNFTDTGIKVEKFNSNNDSWITVFQSSDGDRAMDKSYSPDPFRDYKDYHDSMTQRYLETKNIDFRMMVFICREGIWQRKPNRGLSDNTAGIIGLFLFSMIYKIVFYVDCPYLQAVWTQPNINWYMNLTHIHHNHVRVDWLEYKMSQEKGKLIDIGYLEEFVKNNRITSIRCNRGIILKLLDRGGLINDFFQMHDLTVTNAFQKLHDFLFQPTQKVLDLVWNFKKPIPGEPIVLMQIRVGDSCMSDNNIRFSRGKCAGWSIEKYIKAFTKCGEDLERRLNRHLTWYVMSDNEQVKKRISLYRDDKQVIIPTFAVTSRASRYSEKSQLLHLVSEILYGRNSDYFIISEHSGLGRQIAFRSGRQENNTYYGSRCEQIPVRQLMSDSSWI